MRSNERKQGLYYVTVATKEGVKRTWKRAYPKEMLELAGELMHQTKGIVEYTRMV